MNINKEIENIVKELQKEYQIKIEALNSHKRFVFLQDKEDKKFILNIWKHELKTLREKE